MPVLHSLLCLFFRLLYRPFAWAYDLVAWAVSLGRWKDWVESVVPFIEGDRVLELGHGPGHLQNLCLDLGLPAFGLDESRQMGYLAKKRLQHKDHTKINLICARGQGLPFPNKAFDAVVATFPAEYIFEQQTLSEVRRTLKAGGRFIVLPLALITGQSPPNRFAAWLFRVTGQAPSDLGQESTEKLTRPFSEAGFLVETEQLEVKSSLVLIVKARIN